MIRFLSLLSAGILLAASPISIGTMQHVAYAQSAKVALDGPAVKRMKRVFEKPIKMLKSTRNLDDQESLEKEIQDTKKLLSEQLKLIKPDGSKEAQRRIGDIRSAISLLSSSS